MHNRGNGKGGGIAAVGLSPDDMGVSGDVLKSNYLIQVAFLDPEARGEVERDYLLPALEVDHAYQVPTVDDYREVEGLEVAPPQVWRYFCRGKADAMERLAEERNLEGWASRQVEDELIYRNSYRLNQQLYASLEEGRAFVLSHGRDIMVFKLVGYAEQVAEYYRLEDQRAHVWIAHQRYPTKGRVWHPGGAHPFIGLNEALVHNGDFANYHSVCEYLRQRDLFPQFLTDTEVAVLLFDLWDRVYGYPLEYIIEALAPTTERDLQMLPPEKREIYETIQTTHIHASPDGPWFFIIARSKPDDGFHQLLGITDTSMLRPQVFALQEGEVQIGLIASEKQAIDATLESLAAEDGRFSPIADRYWNARGGSYTDGGAFAFTLDETNRLSCTDKFGRPVVLEEGRKRQDPPDAADRFVLPASVGAAITGGDGAFEVYRDLSRGMAEWDFASVAGLCENMRSLARQGDDGVRVAIASLTDLLDRRYDAGWKKPGSVRTMLRAALYDIFGELPSPNADGGASYFTTSWEDRETLAAPGSGRDTLVVDVSRFPPEGSESASRFLVEAHRLGWRRFIAFDCRGQRFLGCGWGTASSETRLDVYGSPGDYLGSGLDGAEIYVHDSGQDQLGQILKSGKLVIYGDVGQTFLYGAKGGEVYVLGNAAGRPLINAVGHPRVVINGSALDYLAESFMAGDPLSGGGFVILNGLTFDGSGNAVPQETPYPGGNLFSLASGGAIYLRDPSLRVDESQLNGGEFAQLTDEDWELILPYLKENERLFGISVEGDLLTVNGSPLEPDRVYRKVQAVRLSALT
jgi:glutamate synthase domain-containing protein 1/glutamate synthase domain-containing protein 3